MEPRTPQNFMQVPALMETFYRDSGEKQIGKTEDKWLAWPKLAAQFDVRPPTLRFGAAAFALRCEFCENRPAEP
jgi:hypothetical protein